MKSKQQIKNQNTNCCRQTHPPPVSESMQPASIADRKKSASSARIAGWKKSASPASFLSPKNSFLFPNPALSAEKKKQEKTLCSFSQTLVSSFSVLHPKKKKRTSEKTRKNKTGKKNQQNQEKQNPNSKSILAK
jgi:hypothetical protein